MRRTLHTMICGLLPQCSCRQSHAPDGPHRTSGRTNPTGLLPSTITCRSLNHRAPNKAARPAVRTSQRCTRRHELDTVADDCTTRHPRRRPACAGPHRRQGRTSSLRCGRSTLTSTPVRRDTPASQDASHQAHSPAPHTDKEHRSPHFQGVVAAQTTESPQRHTPSDVRHCRWHRRTSRPRRVTHAEPQHRTTAPNDGSTRDRGRSDRHLSALSGCPRPLPSHTPFLGDPGPTSASDARQVEGSLGVSQTFRSPVVARLDVMSGFAASCRRRLEN